MEGHRLGELPRRESMEELAGATPMERGTHLPPPALALQVDRPGAAKIASTEIEPPQLELVLSRCRRERTTLEGALLAAIMLEGPIDGCLAPVNVRHLCPPVADDFGLYISSGTALLDRNSAADSGRSRARPGLAWFVRWSSKGCKRGMRAWPR